MTAKMIKNILVLIFVLHHINCENENFSFFLHCLPPEECQNLSDNFLKCGGTEEAPKYMCPMEKEFCNCQVIHECEKLNELAVSRKFNELKTNYKSCGFDQVDRKLPKYCCPPLTQEESLIASIWNVEYEE